MKKLLIAAAIAVAGATSAQAADLPARVYTKAPPVVVDPAVNWSGFYVGAHFGYMWGRSSVWDNGALVESNAPTNGVVGGVLGGFNWQIGQLVLGIEGDFGGSNAHGNGALPPVPPPTESYLYDVGWTSHVRGRAGYATGPWLLFVAGGLAIAQDTLTIQQTGPTPTTMQPLGVYTGWSVGGGAEYAFNNRMSGRLEYLYDDFGKRTYVVGVNDAYANRLTGQTVRAAINFRLSPN
jgi:outer membrane immunogenic protein